jgi:hypothetical protein
VLRALQDRDEQAMDVKDAISTAKTYVHDLYGESETISDLSLEEVEFDKANDQWRITVEFSRPVSSGFRTRARELLESAGLDAPTRRRVQKVVLISDPDGKAFAMRNREAA